jgi:23S rRNA pseudouridine2605 synthase
MAAKANALPSCSPAPASPRAARWSLITEGRVRLNDELVTTPATILKNLKGVSVDGKLIAAAAPRACSAFTSPPGLITAERDPPGTIYNALRNALPPIRRA